MNDLLGSYWYCAASDAKKTMCAVAHAFRVHDATGFPIIAIDSMDAWNFNEWPHAGSIKELNHQVYGLGKSCAIGSDIDEAVVASIYETARNKRCGKVIILMDEASCWVNRRSSLGKSLKLAIRGFKHPQLLLLFTTQTIHDIHADAISNYKSVYIGTHSAPKDHDELWQSYRISKEEVSPTALPPAHFIEVRGGVAMREANGCPKIVELPTAA